MILNGNERAGAQRLAQHLMNTRDNDHVELYDLRGFVADDLHGALQEVEAIAKGTRCQKHLFSLSLNPPEHEDVPTEVFEAAIDKIERQLGLEGQPRAIVFHEKEGRRHAHTVWSKIDGERMKAINLSFYKRELTGISKELFLENGWPMPNGLRDHRQRDPLKFTLEEWQQARRTKQNPKQIKSMIRECWSRSDDRNAFEAAMRENGYWLARGDRRGFVAVDWRGEVFALSRMTGVKTKDLQTRLGDPKNLLSTDMAKAHIGAKLTPKLKAWVKEEREKREKADLSAKFQREQMVQRQRRVRDDLKRRHDERWLREEKIRAERTPKGIRGLWGWITGANRKIRQQNEAEIARASARDAAEKHDVIRKQLAERQTLQRQVKLAREKQQEKLQELSRDVALAMELRKIPESSATPKRGRSRDKSGQRRRDRGDDFTPN